MSVASYCLQSLIVTDKEAKKYEKSIEDELFDNTCEEMCKKSAERVDKEIIENFKRIGESSVTR